MLREWFPTFFVRLTNVFPWKTAHRCQFDAVASSRAVVALELQFGADKVADRRNAPTVGCLSRVDHLNASVSGPTCCRLPLAWTCYAHLHMVSGRWRWSRSRHAVPTSIKEKTKLLAVTRDRRLTVQIAGQLTRRSPGRFSAPVRSAASTVPPPAQRPLQLVAPPTFPSASTATS
jgi:hypothetical protein